MKKRALIWMLIAQSLITGLSACILVPVGGGGDDYHHGSGGYHEEHEHDRDHY
ncbi:hypothetical protein [Paraburkholderia aromaticivorans]|uniref:hypothetical protein n=1 Tax=Paraburkholderia aromaticivorans TaxID=2026199 RepID=UPI00145615A2|nr:hypothetical protein [Paraburkholderia aromaticivorans]